MAIPKSSVKTYKPAHMGESHRYFLSTKNSKKSGSLEYFVLNADSAIIDVVLLRANQTISIVEASDKLSDLEQVYQRILVLSLCMMRELFISDLD